MSFSPVLLSRLFDSNKTAFTQIQKFDSLMLSTYQDEDDNMTLWKDMKYASFASRPCDFSIISTMKLFFLGLFVLSIVVLVFIINFVCRVFLLATNVIEIKKEEEKVWISIIYCVLVSFCISLI